MLEDLGALLGLVTECLARGLQAFINNFNLIASASGPQRIDAPAFMSPALHYFFADERLKHLSTSDVGKGSQVLLRKN